MRLLVSFGGVVVLAHLARRGRQRTFRKCAESLKDSKFEQFQDMLKVLPFKGVFRKSFQSYLDYTVHVHSLLILLLNREESRPCSLNTFLCQDVAAWNVTLLHQLRLESAQILASFFSKQHIYYCLTAERRVWHAMPSVPT